MDLGIACFSVLLFSGFVLYDTQQIMKRVSVDEAILGALTLYLDFLNLFLSVLRVVSLWLSLSTVVQRSLTIAQ